jgi:hypothetical protein
MADNGADCLTTEILGPVCREQHCVNTHRYPAQGLSCGLFHDIPIYTSPAHYLSKSLAPHYLCVSSHSLNLKLAILILKPSAFRLLSHVL